jgi:hypothetical protein
MDIIRAVLLIALGVILGTAITLATLWTSQPHCPTEDSCVVDYHDGAWHIQEVQP